MLMITMTITTTRLTAEVVGEVERRMADTGSIDALSVWVSTETVSRRTLTQKRGPCPRGSRRTSLRSRRRSWCRQRRIHHQLFPIINKASIGPEVWLLLLILTKSIAVEQMRRGERRRGESSQNIVATVADPGGKSGHGFYPVWL